jgi:hypothetical protein
MHEDVQPCGRVTEAQLEKASLSGCETEQEKKVKGLGPAVLPQFSGDFFFCIYIRPYCDTQQVRLKISFRIASSTNLQYVIRALCMTYMFLLSRSSQIDCLYQGLCTCKVDFLVI